MSPKNNSEKAENNIFLRVAAYVRCSHQEQKLHGYTISHQKKAIQKYADEHGMVIVKWYIDEAKSGSKNQTKRTEFQKMMNDIKAGKIDFILFTKLDRYFRNIREFYRCEDILEKNGGVRWKATEESFDNYTVKGKEMLHFKIVFAQMESDRIGERINFTFGNMVSEKKPISGSQPWGYKIEGSGRDKIIVKDKTVEDIIYDIYDHYEMYRSKRATTKYICEKYEKPISYKRVTKVLTNDYYTGTYRGIEDYAPPYITKNRFERIQEIVKGNVKQTKTNQNYYFSGLVICADCGCRCSGNTSKGGNKKLYKNYRCSRFNNYGTCPNGNTFSEIKLEKYLLDNIVDEIEKYEVAAKVSEAEKKKPSINKSAIKGKIKRIQQMYRDEMMEYDDFKEEYKELSERLKQAEIEEKQVEKRDLTPIKDLFESGFSEVYITLSDKEKAAFWGKVLREIKVHHNKKIDIFF